MLRLRQILQMLNNGIPQVEICGIVHCSKRTVSGYRKIVSMREENYEELLIMSDSELETIFMPAKWKIQPYLPPFVQFKVIPCIQFKLPPYFQFKLPP